MSKFRSRILTYFQMRVADLSESEAVTGKGIVANATMRSGLPFLAAQNARRQKGVS